MKFPLSEEQFVEWLAKRPRGWTANGAAHNSCPLAQASGYHIGTTEFSFLTMRRRELGVLPYWPRLLSREQSAAYCGLSPNAFLAEVEAGTFPASVALSTTRRRLWDRVALDRALDSRLTTPANEDRDVRKKRWQERQSRPSKAG